MGPFQDRGARSPYNSNVAIHVLDPAVGAGDEQFGLDQLFDRKDHTILDTDTDRGSIRYTDVERKKYMSERPLHRCEYPSSCMLALTPLCLLFSVPTVLDCLSSIFDLEDSAVW